MYVSVVESVQVASGSSIRIVASQCTCRPSADRAAGHEHAVLPASIARNGSGGRRQRGQSGRSAYALRARQNGV